MRRVEDAVHEVAGIAHAGDVLGQWEGFAQFCRCVLDVEPLVLTAAFSLGGDPAAEVAEAYPQAAVDEAHVAMWAAKWTGKWRRRFPAARAAG